MTGTARVGETTGMETFGEVTGIVGTSGIWIVL
jgi:hypothetical protein